MDQKFGPLLHDLLAPQSDSTISDKTHKEFRAFTTSCLEKLRNVYRTQFWLPAFQQVPIDAIHAIMPLTLNVCVVFF